MKIGKTTAIFLPAMLAVWLSAGLGADFWEKKDYKKWSNNECAKMLQNSPWAQQYTLTQQSGDATGGQLPYIKYTIQFRSALPVRQAMVRQMQIANKYDSLPPEKQQAFDQQAGSFLSADYSNLVVVHVTYETNVQSLDMALARYWQSQVASVFSNSVHLISSNGIKVPLSDFKVAQGAQREFQYIFPRQYEGRPLLANQDKNLLLEFTYPAADMVQGSMGDGKGMAEFKVKNMLINGEVAY